MNKLKKFTEALDESGGFYVMGIKQDGTLCFYDGNHNPYDVTLERPPLGWLYDKKNDAIKRLNLVRGPLVKIRWSIISESEFIEYRIKWCEDYLAHYKK